MVQPPSRSSSRGRLLNGSQASVYECLRAGACSPLAVLTSIFNNAPNSHRLAMGRPVTHAAAVPVCELHFAGAWLYLAHGVTATACQRVEWLIICSCVSSCVEGPGAYSGGKGDASAHENVFGPLFVVVMQASAQDFRRELRPKANLKHK